MLEASCGDARVGRCANRPVGTNAPPEARRRCARRRAKGSRMPGIHTLVRSACWQRARIQHCKHLCWARRVQCSSSGCAHASMGQTAMASTPGMWDTVCPGWHPIRRGATGGGQSGPDRPGGPQPGLDCSEARAAQISRAVCAAGRSNLVCRSGWDALSRSQGGWGWPHAGWTRP